VDPCLSFYLDMSLLSIKKTDSKDPNNFHFFWCPSALHPDLKFYLIVDAIHAQLSENSLITVSVAEDIS